MSQPTSPAEPDPRDVGGEPYSSQPYSGQPYGAAPASGQPYGGQPYADQGYAGQPSGQYYAPAYGAPVRRTNTMAVVSLVAGIAGLTALPVIASIVAVITGHMARREIARTGEEGSGMVTAGLILGYIGVALLVLGGIALILFLAFAATSTEWSSYS